MHKGRGRVAGIAMERVVRDRPFVIRNHPFAVEIHCIGKNRGGVGGQLLQRFRDHAVGCVRDPPVDFADRFCVREGKRHGLRVKISLHCGGVCVVQRKSDIAVEPDPVRDLRDPGSGEGFLRGVQTVVEGENVVISQHIGQRSGCIPGRTVCEYGKKIVDGIGGENEIFSGGKGFVEQLR